MNSKLKTDILFFLQQRKPAESPPNVPSSSSSPPVLPQIVQPIAFPHIVHHMGPQVVVDNRVIHVQAPNQPRSEADKKEDQNKPPSALQVLGAAGLLTATAVGVSYLFHNNSRLGDMKHLKARCEFVSDSLGNETIDQCAKSMLLDVITLLETDIGHASTAQQSKLASLASFGATGTGLILVPGFLTSLLGLASLGIGCGALVVMANNYFSANAKQGLAAKLETQIRDRILELEQLEAQANSIYPEAYPSAPKE